MTTALAIALAISGSEPPAGSLLLAGGGSTRPETVRRFFREIGGPGGLILVIPLMRESAQEAGEQSRRFLRDQGASRVEVFSDVELKPQDKELLRKKMCAAKGLWLPGGDQGLFLRRVGVDFAQGAFREAVKRGVCIYGTSAGAMLMSDPMIDGWLEDGRPRRSPGLGLVPFLVDTHYRERNRRGRLEHALEHWRAHDRAVGLSEGEWILWRDGEVAEASGRPEWLELVRDTGRASRVARRERASCGGRVCSRGTGFKPSSTPRLHLHCRLESRGIELQEGGQDPEAVRPGSPSP